MAYVAVSFGSLWNDQNRNLRWVKTQSRARSVSHSHNGNLSRWRREPHANPDWTQSVSFQSPKALAVRRSRQFRPFMSDSRHQTLARSIHSQQILLADCITKARKGNAVDLLCRSQRCGPGRTSYKRCSFLDLQLHVASTVRFWPRIDAAPQALDDERTTFLVERSCASASNCGKSASPAVRGGGFLLRQSDG
jgi:hypothetical protein